MARAQAARPRLSYALVLLVAVGLACTAGLTVTSAARADLQVKPVDDPAFEADLQNLLDGTLPTMNVPRGPLHRTITDRLRSIERDREFVLDVDELEQLALWVDHLRDLRQAFDHTTITLVRAGDGYAYARVGDVGNTWTTLTHSKRTPA